MLLQLVVVTATVVALASSSESNPVAFLSGAKLSNSTQIFLPSNSNIEQRWDIFSPPSYSLAIKPGNEQDLQTIVRLASKSGIPFLATGGGHGTSGTLGEIMNGLEVDLGNFNSITLDSENDKLTVGGGTKFSGFINLLYDAGKELPIVASDCIGVLGATLGGGVGIMQGIHGLLLDSLESVQMVTASGELVTASDEVNPGLFWGIRGAGHNFGIITSATYKVHDITNQGQVVNADFLFTAAQNRSIWEFMGSLDDDLSANLAFTFFASPDPRVPIGSGLPPIIVVNAVYFGPKEEAMPYLEPLLALQPGMSNISTIPFNDVFNAVFFGQDATSGGCEKGENVNIYSISLKKTDVATWEAHFNELTDFYVQYPGYAGRLLVQRFPNQAALAIADSATAYPFREAKIHLNMEGWYTNRSLDGPVNEFLSSSRAKFQATGGFSDLSVYVNYARGDEGPRGWYSSRKLDRLNALKEQWDPQWLFSWNNPITGSVGGRKTFLAL